MPKSTGLPTFARATNLNPDVVRMVIGLLKHYNWKQFAIMYEPGDTWDPIYKALQKETDGMREEHGTNVEFHKAGHDDDKPQAKTTHGKAGKNNNSRKRKRRDIEGGLEQFFDPFLERLQKVARGMFTFRPFT